MGRVWLEPGELVSATVFNWAQDPTATGKARPVMLVEASGPAHWTVMGLTSQPAYQDGSPRVAVPDWAAVGLRVPGWLWGDRLIRLNVGWIVKHIGWADHALAERVIDLARLSGPTSAGLLGAVADRSARHPDAAGG